MTRSVCVVHEDRPPTAATADMIAVLRDRGVKVDILTALPQLSEARRAGADLYVLKHSDPPRLALAARLHGEGRHLFNRYPVVAACRDKEVATRRLARSGLPVPITTVMHDPRGATTMLRRFPLVVKPIRGSRGRGVTVARTADDLAAIDPAGGPFLVQRFHPGDGTDRKLYRIGRHLFCVGRPWPADTPEAKQGTPTPIDAELEAIGRQVGDALGTDLFGVDVVYSDGRPWVVDVSAFPGFKGVPDAGRALADRVQSELRSVRRSRA